MGNVQAIASRIRSITPLPMMMSPPPDETTCPLTPPRSSVPPVTLNTVLTGRTLGSSRCAHFAETRTVPPHKLVSATLTALKLAALKEKGSS